MGTAPAPAPATPLSLAAAITAVEASQAAVTNQQSVIANDTAAAAAIQAKLDAANAVVANDQAALVPLNATALSDLQNLLASTQAAITALTPSSPPAS